MAPTDKEKRKTIRTFAWASFLNDMGSDMIYPVWPLFLTTVLNANMAVVGLVDGIGKAFVSVSQALAGYYSDKLKRRKIFIWTLPASLLAGILWDSLSVETPFMLSLGLTMIALIMLVFVKEDKKPEQP